MSPDTAQFLLDLLDTLTIQVSQPGYLDTAARVQKAQDELRAIIAATDGGATLAAVPEPETIEEPTQ